MSKLRVIVDAEVKDGRVYLTIGYPSEQGRLPLRQTATILTGGLSTLIKGCTYDDAEVKDYELIEQVVDQLSAEFADVDAFSDVKINKDLLEKDE